MKFTFDPAKDAANILKHGISLADAPPVFNAPDKLTLETQRSEEQHLMDVALVEVLRHPNEVRAISLRRASKQERKLYAGWQETH